MTYSTLALSHKTDKPHAVAGLERRIEHAFKSESLHGVLWRGSWAQRTLLWCAAKSGSLKRIDYTSGVEQPPASWSWMAYDGRIAFLDIPFAGVEWFHSNIRGPPTAGERGIEAEASELSVHKAEWMEKAVLDVEGMQADVGLWRCVLVGKREAGGEADDAAHYVLLVRPVISASLPDTQTEHYFERVGVAILLESHFSTQTKPIFIV